MQIINYTPDFKFSFPTIVTVGMFDGVHIGHQAILSALKKHHNTKTLVITFDNHPRTILHQDSEKFKLLSSQEEKFERIANHGIDYLLLMPFNKELASLSAIEFAERILIEQCNVKTLILGYDNHFGNKQKGHFEDIFKLAEKHLFSIETVDSYSFQEISISSTQIRNALENGNILLANQMLGYCYSFSAKVVHGKKIGRQIGFPTANLKMTDSQKLIPKEGVYAVKVQIEEKCYNGMMSIGKQLTFGFDDILVEVNIFDFNDTIYDNIITVSLIEKIRDIQKFASKEELILALESDREKCQKIASNE